MAMPTDSLGYSVQTRRYPVPVLLLLATMLEPAETRRETPYITFMNSTRLIDLFYRAYPNGDYYTMLTPWRNLSFDEAREWLYSVIVEPEASDQEVITMLDTIAAAFCMAIPDTNKFGTRRLQAAQQALLTPSEDRARRLTAALKTSMICAGCGEEIHAKEVVSFARYGPEFFCSQCLTPVMNRCQCGKVKGITASDCGCGTKEKEPETTSFRAAHWADDEPPPRGRVRPQDPPELDPERGPALPSIEDQADEGGWFDEEEEI